ncbi:hypothetical protein CANTEDRAFT_102265 [Yamadazyma tenuis ATCC 10573]|uniref:Zn(2)-C6 fungal-type domain-containing protein n=1 Tax=Candida tenuis (strain ATCC 10573 / BCRC 21748 / CBS 615 / JCM 9827 / NBRC 10315 / NRRL Y-1498 / VKM Y-70) TaxID=590646 RepID=G3AZG0_CANTC|nr:uncharacterized protein CANTEDRAFT_102265 [Yamadazyma tenuis ATCC 10573]EGV66087.1 hypothetical protein CANTEDRAFT_102265 [Yamadazyma tenuis ATCC 10573]
MEEPSKKKIKKNSNVVRRRALTACNTCRIKKVKCDNIRPRCGSCVKNGVDNCEYSHEDQFKDVSLDPTSVTILSKLDVILDEMKTMGASRPRTKAFVTASRNGVWDMSFSSFMQWRFFNEKMPELSEESDEMEARLMELYTSGELDSAAEVDDILGVLKSIEEVMTGSLSQSLNSYFVNCHTKVPLVDVLDFIESVEIYKALLKAIPGFTLSKLALAYHRAQGEDREIDAKYMDALTEISIRDPQARKDALDSLCRKIPLIPVVCALGVLSSPIQFDNFAKYKSSVEERNDVTTSCLTRESISKIPESVKKERFSIANSLVTYAKVIVDIFPSICKEYTTESIVFNILLHQFSMYTMRPIVAYRHINLACHDIMYFIEKSKNGGHVYYKDEATKGLMERMFWICLKLECEMRAELSPRVPVSGILDIEPPCNFPTVPDPIINQLESEYHSVESVRIATKFDDQYTWYYFLTEVATRKVDNEMFDEFYSIDANEAGLFDQPKFYDETFWISFIRYSNQYNGIINSLSPRIRNFVLKEVDIAQVFKSISSAYERRRANDGTSNQVLSDHLDDFLIDDNLIIQAQSEAIMYIKTRILTSKLLLFRPMIYFILEDKIPIEDLIEAVVGLISDEQTQYNDMGDHSSTSSSDVPTSSFDHDVGINYEKLLEAPLYFQKNNTHEDFSNFFTSDGKSDESAFKMNLLGEARKKTLKLFLINLKSMPKLNMPKLGGHRHPGQWFYLRNLLIGGFYLFLLHKKIGDLLEAIRSDENQRSVFSSNPIIQSLGNLSDVFDSILPKEMVTSTLEHSLLVYEYWKKESKDCEVYAEIISKLLAACQD